MNPSDFRRICGCGDFQTQTSGQVPGYAQANLLILPSTAAADFKDLCSRNPVPLSLLATTEAGEYSRVDNLFVLDDEDFDIRTNFPKYNVYDKGQLVSTTTDIKSLWDPKSSVGFLIGCSFSFEHALAVAGLPAKNAILNKTVSMYQTTKFLDNAGIFTHVPYIVSMRPYKLKDLEVVRSITRQYRKTHGEPIDWGFDAVQRLGIANLERPEYGDCTEFAEDEIPVFWGCGVTAQVAAMSVADKIDGLVIGHVPGHMLVLDIKDEDIVAMGHGM